MAVYEPKINSVAITPNPVNINNAFLIVVSVSDVKIAMYMVSPISGTFKAGQAIKPSTHTEVAN